jgi:hypothetical protein
MVGEARGSRAMRGDTHNALASETTRVKKSKELTRKKACEGLHTHPNARPGQSNKPSQVQ